MEGAREFALLAVLVVSCIFLRNERNDVYVLDGEIVEQPGDVQHDEGVDLDGTVFAPVAGLIPVTVLDWSKLSQDQMGVVRHAFTGTKEAWGDALLAITSISHANHLMHESVYEGSVRLVLGNWGSYVPGATRQVLLLDIEALLHDSQSGNSSCKSAVMSLGQLEECGPLNVSFIQYWGAPNSIEKGSIEVWRKVLIGNEGYVCVVVFLAAVVCMMVPLHPKDSKHSTGHTLNFASGGVLSTGGGAEVELPPVMTWGGNQVIGGTGSADVLNAVGAVVLEQIVQFGLQFAPTEKVTCLLREGLRLLPPAKSLELPEPVIVALTASLQRQAQLPL